MQLGWKDNRLTWRQIRGFLLFFLCKIILLFTYFILPVNSKTVLHTDTEEIREVIAEIENKTRQDSLDRLPIKYPFNPNYITDYQAYIHHIDIASLDSLRAYREKGKWINSITDFQKITQWDTIQIQGIQAYLKFPDWSENSNSKPSSSIAKKISISKKNLNLASLDELMEVSGIGEVLANRIVDWRIRLGDFVNPLQIKHVYGLNDWTRTKLWEYFYIDEKEVTPRVNINEASASDLSTIPGVSFELARKIWEFQYLREGVEDIEELNKIEGMTSGKLELIALYLYAN